jgi:hypothetical protein
MSQAITLEYFRSPSFVDWFFGNTCPEPNSGCLLWTESLDKDGYGRVRTTWKKSGNIPAHRLAWLIAYGRWPEPCGLHRCDTRPCVNVQHLFEGTREDNMRDMWSKGRGAQTQKTHCPNGHEYAGYNLILHGRRRYCRTCMNEHKRNFRARS